MTALSQLYNIHFEDCFGYDFAVLLRHSDKLGHILHASNRLEDLSTHSEQGLAAIGQLLRVLHELGRPAVGGSARVSTPCLRQLHQVGDLI